MRDDSLTNDGGLQGAFRRGVSTLDEWVASGVLIDAAEPTEALKGPLQASDSLGSPGSLGSVAVRGRRYYVSTLLQVDAAHSDAICQALQPLSDIEMAIFWLRTHGALGGKTAAEAIKGGGFERVKVLAEATSAQARAAQDLGRS
jgi:hypothetical protein